MKPKSFKINIEYDADSGRLDVYLPNGMIQTSIGIITIKDILEELQKILIRRFV